MIKDSALHTETETNIPTPLSRGGIWNVGTWTIPSNTLTMASMFLFVFTSVFLLQTSSMRELFILPFSDIAFSICIAGAAWAVTVWCGNRPGLHWPKYWVILLSLVTTFLAAISVSEYVSIQNIPLLHIFLVASFTSVSALLPRLFKLHPDSKMVQRVAPITLVLVCLFVFPSILLTEKLILTRHEKRIDALTTKMKKSSLQLSALLDYHWSKLAADNHQEARIQISALRQLSFMGYIGDPDIWYVATILGRDELLLSFQNKIMETLLSSLENGTTPRISNFSDPPYFWNTSTRGWEQNNEFFSRARIIGAYYQQIARLFDELNIELLREENGTLRAFDKIYQSKREVFKETMAKMMERLSDHWIPYYAPDSLRPSKARSLEMVEILQLPVGEKREFPKGVIKLADLPELNKISLMQAREEIAFVPGCAPRENYRYNKKRYFRVDCFSYSPDSDQPGATLSVEMRLVYDLGKSGFERDNFPAEIYYQFPIPDGREEEEFKKKTLQDFVNAIKLVASGKLKKINGSVVKKGFRWVNGNSNIRVYSPHVKPLFYKPGKRIIIRAVKP